MIEVDRMCKGEGGGKGIVETDSPIFGLADNFSPLLSCVTDGPTFHPKVSFWAAKQR